MVKVREDMTGWVMSEHGVPDSRLTVIQQTDDYVERNGVHRARWICECSCEGHNQIVALGKDIRNGNTKSCGCLKIELLVHRSKKENLSDLSGEYGIIWSTNSNQEIYFDLHDAEKILSYTWYINVYGYPETHIDGKAITMHKLLGYNFPDHHNRNKLDNRRQNLILCSQQENSRNRSIRSDNNSGFTGVYFHVKNNKWVAYINPGSGMKYLGSFENKQEAIKERLKAENKYFGDFAPQRHLFKEYGIEGGIIL